MVATDLTVEDAGLATRSGEPPVCGSGKGKERMCAADGGGTSFCTGEQLSGESARSKEMDQRDNCAGAAGLLSSSAVREANLAAGGGYLEEGTSDLMQDLPGRQQELDPDASGDHACSPVAATPWISSSHSLGGSRARHLEGVAGEEEPRASGTAKPTSWSGRLGADMLSSVRRVWVLWNGNSSETRAGTAGSHHSISTLSSSMFLPVPPTLVSRMQRLAAQMPQLPGSWGSYDGSARRPLGACHSAHQGSRSGLSSSCRTAGSGTHENPLYAFSAPLTGHTVANPFWDRSLPPRPRQRSVPPQASLADSRTAGAASAPIRTRSCCLASALCCAAVVCLLLVVLVPVLLSRGAQSSAPPLLPAAGSAANASRSDANSSTTSAPGSSLPSSAPAPQPDPNRSAPSRRPEQPGADGGADGLVWWPDGPVPPPSSSTPSAPSALHPGANGQDAPGWQPPPPPPPPLGSMAGAVSSSGPSSTGEEASAPEQPRPRSSAAGTARTRPPPKGQGVSSNRTERMPGLGSSDTDSPALLDQLQPSARPAVVPRSPPAATAPRSPRNGTVPAGAGNGGSGSSETDEPLYSPWAAGMDGDPASNATQLNSTSSANANSSSAAIGSAGVREASATAGNSSQVLSASLGRPAPQVGWNRSDEGFGSVLAQGWSEDDAGDADHAGGSNTTSGPGEGALSGASPQPQAWPSTGPAGSNTGTGQPPSDVDKVATAHPLAAVARAAAPSRQSSGPALSTSRPDTARSGQAQQTRTAAPAASVVRPASTAPGSPPGTSHAAPPGRTLRPEGRDFARTAPGSDSASTDSPPAVDSPPPDLSGEAVGVASLQAEHLPGAHVHGSYGPDSSSAPQSSWPAPRPAAYPSSAHLQAAKPAAATPPLPSAYSNSAMPPPAPMAPYYGGYGLGPSMENGLAMPAAYGVSSPASLQYGTASSHAAGRAPPPARHPESHPVSAPQGGQTAASDTSTALPAVRTPGGGTAGEIEVAGMPVVQESEVEAQTGGDDSVSQAAGPAEPSLPTDIRLVVVPGQLVDAISVGEGAVLLITINGTGAQSSLQLTTGRQYQVLAAAGKPGTDAQTLLVQQQLVSRAGSKLLLGPPPAQAGNGPGSRALKQAVQAQGPSTYLRGTIWLADHRFAPIRGLQQQAQKEAEADVQVFRPQPLLGNGLLAVPFSSTTAAAAQLRIQIQLRDGRRFERRQLVEFRRLLSETAAPFETAAPSGTASLPSGTRLPPATRNPASAEGQQGAAAAGAGLVSNSRTAGGEQRQQQQGASTGGAPQAEVSPAPSAGQPEDRPSTSSNAPAGTAQQLPGRSSEAAQPLQEDASDAGPQQQEASGRAADRREQPTSPAEHGCERPNRMQPDSCGGGKSGSWWKWVVAAACGLAGLALIAAAGLAIRAKHASHSKVSSLAPPTAKVEGRNVGEGGDCEPSGLEHDEQPVPTLEPSFKDGQVALSAAQARAYQCDSAHLVPSLPAAAPEAEPSATSLVQQLPCVTDGTPGPACRQAAEPATGRPASAAESITNGAAAPAAQGHGKALVAMLMRGSCPPAGFNETRSDSGLDSKGEAANASLLQMLMLHRTKGNARGAAAAGPAGEEGGGKLPPVEDAAAGLLLKPGLAASLPSRLTSLHAFMKATAQEPRRGSSELRMGPCMRVLATEPGLTRWLLPWEDAALRDVTCPVSAGLAGKAGKQAPEWLHPAACLKALLTDTRIGSARRQPLHRRQSPVPSNADAPPFSFSTAAEGGPGLAARPGARKRAPSEAPTSDAVSSRRSSSVLQLSPVGSLHGGSHSAAHSVREGSALRSSRGSELLLSGELLGMAAMPHPLYSSTSPEPPAIASPRRGGSRSAACDLLYGSMPELAGRVAGLEVAAEEAPTPAALRVDPDKGSAQGVSEHRPGTGPSSWSEVVQRLASTPPQQSVGHPGLEAERGDKAAGDFDCADATEPAAAQPGRQILSGIQWLRSGVTESRAGPQGIPHDDMESSALQPPRSHLHRQQRVPAAHAVNSCASLAVAHEEMKEMLHRQLRKQRPPADPGDSLEGFAAGVLHMSP